MIASALPTSPLALAALAAALAFLLAVLLLGIARARREEVRAGLAALCAMKWREFAHHVVGTLARRGLVQDDLDRRPGEDGFDIRMTRGAARYLVQCKQVGTLTLGERAVRDFATVVRLQGAEGGILVTTGDMDAAARRAASQSGIELLSGYQLWRQLRALLPVDLVEEIRSAARRRRGRKALVALAIAAGVGVAAFLLASALAPAVTRPTAESAAPAAQETAPAPAAPAAPATIVEPGQADAADAAAAPVLPQQMPDPTLTEDQLAARRAEAERHVRSLPNVDGASWSTRSTMVLTLAAIGDDALPEETVAAACAALVRFEELRYTRLQVQAAVPRTPDEARVRWRQCR